MPSFQSRAVAPFCSALGAAGTPKEENGRIDGQFHHRGGDAAADHRGDDAIHDVSSGAVVDRVTQVRQAAHPAFMLPLCVGRFKIQQNDNADLDNGTASAADCATQCFSTSFMPHLGQSPGLSCTTSGCIEQVYWTAFSLF